MKITKTTLDQYRRRKQIENRACELQRQMDALRTRWGNLGDKIGDERLRELNRRQGWAATSPEWDDVLS